MCKDDLNVHVFQNRKSKPFLTKKFKWKKYGGTGLVSEKREALYAELDERVEAGTSSYSATGEFVQYIYSALVAKNHQKIRSRCLVHEFSFIDIFFSKFRFTWLWLLFAIMKRCAERWALQLYCTSLRIFGDDKRVWNFNLFACSRSYLKLLRHFKFSSGHHKV